MLEPLSVSLRDQDAARTTVHTPPLLQFLVQRGRLDDDAVSDHAALVRMQDSGRDQVQDVLALADDDGVAGVVASLVAGHDVKAFGDEVDDFPLAFVSPLRADDDGVGHGGKEP